MATLLCEDGNVDVPREFIESSAVLKGVTDDTGSTDIIVPNLCMRAVRNLLNGPTDVPHDELIEMTLAADFLAQEEILDQCCKKIALNIQGMTKEQIKTYLGLSHLPSDQ